MKRIICIFFAFVLMFTLVGVSAFAEEPVDEAIVTEETESNETIFTRLYEAYLGNKSEVFTVGGSALLFVLGMFFKKSSTASAKQIVDGIARVLAKTDLSDEKQNAIVGGLNEMVDGYNDIKLQSTILKQRVDEFAADMSKVRDTNVSLEEKIDHFFTVMVSLMDKEILQNATVMEVLSSVCANNDDLPKGIKDFVSLKRTENAQLVHEAALIEHKDEGGVASE